MKLFIVIDYDRWHSTNVVRARDAAAAQALVAPHSRRCEVEELADDGSAKVLWCDEVCPDSRD